MEEGKQKSLGTVWVWFLKVLSVRKNNWIPTDGRFGDEKRASRWKLRLGCYFLVCGGNYQHFKQCLKTDGVILGQYSHINVYVLLLCTYLFFSLTRGLTAFQSSEFTARGTFSEQFYQTVCQIYSFLLVMSVVISCFKAWLTSCHPQTSSVYQRESLRVAQESSLASKKFI